MTHTIYHEVGINFNRFGFEWTFCINDENEDHTFDGILFRFTFLYIQFGIKKYND